MKCEGEIDWLDLIRKLTFSKKRWNDELVLCRSKILINVEALFFVLITIVVFKFSI